MENKNMKAYRWATKLAGVAVFGLTMATSQHVAVANAVCVAPGTDSGPCNVTLTATVGGAISLDIGPGTPTVTMSGPSANIVDFTSVDSACTTPLTNGACRIIQDAALNGAFLVAGLDAKLIYSGGCGVNKGTITLGTDTASSWPGVTQYQLGTTTANWDVVGAATSMTTVPDFPTTVNLTTTLASGSTVSHQVALQLLDSITSGNYTETLVYTGSCLP